jgi:hypothetical protein
MQEVVRLSLRSSVEMTVSALEILVRVNLKYFMGRVIVSSFTALSMDTAAAPGMPLSGLIDFEMKVKARISKKLDTGFFYIVGVDSHVPARRLPAGRLEAL